MDPIDDRRVVGPLETGPNLLGVTDEQAKAITALSGFGATVVTEAGQLARYMGRVLGTIPHDAVGLVIGDPLHFVRAKIAQTYDDKLNKIFARRKVTDTQPVSPSLAIPLLRAAYDESRPELQELWAELIATAMDPKRSSRVRLSFIDTLKRFDPLDALLLKARYDMPGDVSPSAIEFFTKALNASSDEIQLSLDNLKTFNCLFVQPHNPRNFVITTYGRMLFHACSDL